MLIKKNKWSQVKNYPMIKIYIRLIITKIKILYGFKLDKQFTNNLINLKFILNKDLQQF